MTVGLERTIRSVAIVYPELSDVDRALFAIALNALCAMEARPPLHLLTPRATTEGK